MKKSVLLICAVLLIAVGALAQQNSSFTLSAKIPFSFIVRGDLMPAGDYTVRIPSLSVSPMMIGQTAGNKSEFVVQVPVAERWNGRPQLTFHRVGESYFLMEIADSRFGVQRVQQGERYKAALKLASAQTVVIAAK